MRSKALLSSIIAVAVAVSFAAFGQTTARAAATWSTPTQVAVATSAGSISAPHIVTSADGLYVVSVYLLSGASGTAVQAVRSTDGGASWGTAQTLSAVSANASELVVEATLDRGLVVVAWTDSAAALSVVNSVSSTNLGETWTGTRTISNPTYASSEPSLAVASDDVHVYATWTSVETKSVIRAGYSTNAGVSWTAGSSASLLSPNTVNAITSDVATSATGTKVVATWVVEGGPIAGDSSAQIAYSSTSGSTWNTPAATDWIDSANGFGIGKSLVEIDATGAHTMLALEDSNSNVVKTYLSTSLGATWAGAGVNVGNTARVYSDSLSMTLAPESNVLILGWQDQTGNTLRLGISSDFGLTWDVQNLGSANEQSLPVQVASDALGRSFQVVWQQGTLAAGASAVVSGSSDEGASWSSPVTVSGSDLKAGNPSLSTSSDSLWLNVMYPSGNADGDSKRLMSTRTAPAPTVTVISPSSGYINGGTAITITGTGFKSGASVKIGSSAATSVKVASGTSITAVAPAGAAGAVDVTVTNVDGQSGTMTGGFTYSPLKPQIPVKKLYVATKIKPKKWTKLVSVPVTLNSGLRGSPVVTATIPGKAVGAVSKKVFKTKRKSGYLWAYSSGRKRLSVLLSLSASPIGDYAAYSYSKTYKVKKAK